MPLGKVNTGNFSKGTPITLPHQFGNAVDGSEPTGNVQPQANPALDGNPVTWAPSPTHFGNNSEISMQAVPAVILIEQGGTGSFTLPITQLNSFSGSTTLSASGTPVGVSISFTINPATTTSTVEINVGAAVPTGRYTALITGTTAFGTYPLNVNFVVVGNSLPSNAFGFLLEDGSGVILLEDGTILLLENQS
jgi:hypothetical protein